ncbi:hypothetical protein A3Q56_08404 [Intoshia linei]|uniref:Uncharacterized protein n=1 Tax=Intoshia linei TaxID=1819745 RepID=A0A177AR98_9BILA|nr:hypothetical protein A3Q56_08404 [Intoshia linei]
MNNKLAKVVATEYYRGLKRGNIILEDTSDHDWHIVSKRNEIDYLSYRQPYIETLPDMSNKELPIIMKKLHGGHEKFNIIYDKVDYY